MTRRNNPDYREPDYIIRRDDEDFYDYVDRRHRALEPRVANHIIRQLLKMIPPGHEDSTLITDAKHFIKGGRTDHWKDRDVYFRWSENSCRFITDRELEEERAKPRIEAEKREALAKLKEVCEAAGCECRIDERKNGDAFLMRTNYTGRNSWLIALGPDRFEVVLFSRSALLSRSEATAKEAAEILIAEDHNDRERKQRLRDERERKKRLREAESATS